MRTLFILVTMFCTGCNHEPSAEIKARAAELSSGFRKQAEAITAKQDESLSLLAQVNSRVGDLLLAADATKEQIQTLKASLANPQAQQSGGDPAAPEPQETERKSQTTPLLSVSAPAVRLQYFTHDRCSDCKIQEPKSQAAADELGVRLEVFDLKEHDKDFTKAGIDRTPTTLIVIDDKIRVRLVGVFVTSTIVARVKKELSGTKQFVSQPRITNPVVSHGDLVSMHNQLHGGGQWTWPGDLATHLQTVHGVNVNGVSANHGNSQFARQQPAVRPVSRGASRNWRPSYQARGSCPSGGCPR